MSIWWQHWLHTRNNCSDTGIPYLQEWFLDGAIPKFCNIFFGNGLIGSKFCVASLTIYHRVSRFWNHLILGKKVVNAGIAIPIWCISGMVASCSSATIIHWGFCSGFTISDYFFATTCVKYCSFLYTFYGMAELPI